MLFMTAALYGIKGRTTGLQAADVYERDVQNALRAIAQNTARYGMQATDLLDAMAAQGPQILHAVAAFENNTLHFNAEHAQQLRFPFAFIFHFRGHVLGGSALLHS
jgi:hypothetical protein